jgi:hypothetical protein
MTDTIRRSLRCERGSPAIEFALVLPVLLTLLTGMLDLGFMFYVQHTMDDASRAAARAYAIDASANVTTIATGLLPSGISFDIKPPSVTADGMVVVEIDCPAGSATLSGFVTALTDVALVAKTTMVKEW